MLLVEDIMAGGPNSQYRIDITCSKESQAEMRSSWAAADPSRITCSKESHADIRSSWEAADPSRSECSYTFCLSVYSYLQ
ncbi:hypothetical protein JYU34_000867 [Plutella xylostella]|uniref:Uncharacterized protein n=1 Tax=Plutella xylostella TaxID=51655 RepID=A0ABQ7R5P6_PLUXY|nr:hypothetical protein JYU34_000867 [Plutella xylostella]